MFRICFDLSILHAISKPLLSIFPPSILVITIPVLDAGSIKMLPLTDMIFTRTSPETLKTA